MINKNIKGVDTAYEKKVKVECTMRRWGIPFYWKNIYKNWHSKGIEKLSKEISELG